MQENHHTIKFENGIAYVKIVGSGDENVARQFVSDTEKIFEDNPNVTINALVDMLDSGFSNYEGIKVYRNFLKTDRLGKIAFVLNNEVIEAFVKLACTDREKETKYFHNAEDAKEWLEIK